MTKYAGFLAVLMIVAAPAAIASDRTFEVAGWYIFLEPSAEGTFNAGDPAEPFDVSLTSDTGYGVSGMVFFGRRVSLELGVASVKTGIDLDERDADTRLPRRQSTIMPVTATVQFHMRPDAMIDPYIGAGAMMVYFGSIDEIDDDDPSVNEIDATGLGYIINAGLNVELMEQMGLLLDVKWSPSALRARGILNDEPGTPADIDVSPLMVSIGVSWRF